LYEEILTAVKRLKKQKSPGINDITGEEIQAGVKEGYRRVACYLQSNMEGREHARGLGKISRDHITYERRPFSIQQLQNNCTPRPCRQGADGGDPGEVENTDANAIMRGTSRIQEAEVQRLIAQKAKRKDNTFSTASSTFKRRLT